MTGPESATNDRGRRLHVVHCVGFYFPDSVGGSEVYVRDLAAALRDISIDSTIVAATDGPPDRYVWQDVAVVRYPSGLGVAQHRAAAPSGGSRTAFQDLLTELKPDLFHLHSWTSGAGLQHLAQARQLGIPSIVTVHVPSALCLRGTMLLNGKAACDGRIDEKRCASCWALGRGLPAPAAHALARLPKWNAAGKWPSKISHRAATLLSGRAMVASQARELQVMATMCERLVAPSQWVRSALLLNDVAPEKILVSPQAASPSFVRRGERAQAPPGRREIRLGFVGRLESYKGVHTLVEAVASLPQDVPVRLLVAGIGTEPRYFRSLQAAARRDRRIELVGLVEHERLAQFLESLDVLAVPSHYMETGPLVVLEAQALGIPVMGADLGGIAERIRDGVDGWLIPFDDSAAWAAAIAEAATDDRKLAALAANSRRMRTTADVAAEMAALYRQVLEAPRPAPIVPRLPLNLFYEEPDVDRWLPLDRYPRRVIRRFVRGPTQPGGAMRVFLNLTAGLDRLNVPYRVNDYRHLRSHPAELACIIGKPQVLDDIPQQTPILFGPSIYNHPSDAPDLPRLRPIRQIVVPSAWVQRMFAEVWPGLVSVWPVGIDTGRWAPDPAVPKDVDILVYDKISRRREHYGPLVIEPLYAELRRRGLKVETLRYGFYREQELYALTRRARAAVYLSRHETQGIAAEQMLASGLPLLAWDQGGLWEDPDYAPHSVRFGPVTSVPYWDERCGMKFVDGSDLPAVFDVFWRGVLAGAYRPRSMILEKLTLESGAREYLRIVDRFESS